MSTGGNHYLHRALHSLSSLVPFPSHACTCYNCMAIETICRCLVKSDQLLIIFPCKLKCKECYSYITRQQLPCLYYSLSSWITRMETGNTILWFLGIKHQHKKGKIFLYSQVSRNQWMWQQWQTNVTGEVVPV